jgi:hypothetical protein
MMKKDNKANNKFLNEKITRKKAIKKVGITALTAASLMFLSTKAKAGGSPDTPGGPGNVTPGTWG